MIYVDIIVNIYVDIIVFIDVIVVFVAVIVIIDPCLYALIYKTTGNMMDWQVVHCCW